MDGQFLWIRDNRWEIFLPSFENIVGIKVEKKGKTRGGEKATMAVASGEATYAEAKSIFRMNSMIYRVYCKDENFMLVYYMES